MRSLDLCPECHQGRMIVTTTRYHGGDSRVRYLRCETCGETGKEIIPGRPRRRLKKSCSSLELGFAEMGVPSGIMCSCSCHTTEGGAAKGNAMLRDIFQTSKALNIHWQDIRDMTEFGQIPKPIIVAGRLRFRQTDLDRWVANGCPQSAELPDEVCGPFWDCLLTELKANDILRKDSQSE